MSNPGYSHISQKILWLLDHKNQMVCRLVSPAWKALMDDPYFWIEKLDKKGQSKEIHDGWIDLVERRVLMTTDRVPEVPDFGFLPHF